MKIINRIVKVLIISTLLLSLSACVKAWTKTDKPIDGPKKKFNVTLPAGWIWFSIDRKAVTATRDGLNIQSMRFGFWTYEKAFKSLKKKPKSGMLPSELAELIVAVYRKSKLTKNAKILENSPYTIDGNVGFKLRISYNDNHGLRFMRMTYGFGVKDGIYVLSYNAPILLYYNRDLSDFGQAVKTFRVAAKKK